MLTLIIGGNIPPPAKFVVESYVLYNCFLPALQREAGLAQGLMEELLITETQDTPHVHLNRDNGIFEIAGRSLPEDTVDFYTPVVTWLRNYAKSPNTRTDFHIRLEYFNTASSKMILDLLLALKEIPGTRIIWHYYADDEAIDEAGHEYAEQVDIPFVFEVN